MSGKRGTAVVTGAPRRGIGRSIVEQLAAEGYSRRRDRPAARGRGDGCGIACRRPRCGGDRLLVTLPRIGSVRSRSLHGSAMSPLDV